MEIKFKMRRLIMAIVMILPIISADKINAQTTNQDSIVCTQFEKDLKSYSIDINRLEKSNKKDYKALSKI